MLETILLCANKTISVRYQYLKPFNRVQIKLLEAGGNNLDVCKKWLLARLKMMLPTNYLFTNPIYLI